MVDLQDLRNEIDSIDRQMTELFEKRMEISRKVAKYKISTGKKVFDKEREKKVIEKAKDMTHNDFNRHGIEELFQQIMAMSRKLQYQLLEENGVAGRLPFIGVDELEKENVRVVFQGVEGAYSQAAMQQYFAIRSPRSMWSTGEMRWRRSQKVRQTMQCCRLRIQRQGASMICMTCW